MPRYKLTIEYDGRPFAGWQRQANARSVQHELEEAFRRYCGETLVVHAAGRTDAGVHARGQVAHVDLARERSASSGRIPPLGQGIRASFAAATSEVITCQVMMARLVKVGDVLNFISAGTPGISVAFYALPS